MAIFDILDRVPWSISEKMPNIYVWSGLTLFL